MPNYSIVLANATDFGQLADLSLSTGVNALSLSVWLKTTDHGSHQVMGNFNYMTAVGGYAIDIIRDDPAGAVDQLEFALTADTTIPSLDPTGLDNEFGLVSPTTVLGDGNWHSLISTYDGTGVFHNINTVVDSTHLTIDDTTGFAPGDRVWYRVNSTLVTAVPDGTHMTVVDTTGFVNGGVISNKGIELYLDGVLITHMADWQFTPVGNQYDSTIPFGIGDPQQTAGSKPGKYAYPAVYHRLLSAAEAATIAAGANISTGAVGQWLFTEGSGTTAADSSGNSHTLTFNSLSWDTDVPFGGGSSFIRKKSSAFLVY